jgi:predicted enzyme related to lactoylglutathione lyase
MHGQFCWYELTTPDVEAATKFYPRLTGWGIQAFDKDYQMFAVDGVPVAGIFRLKDDMRAQGVPPNWMPYVEAENVDGMAARAVTFGGMVIVPPTDIPGTGRFAVLQDPQGATFGVYKSSTMPGGWDGKPVEARFSWHELMTTDYEKAFEFYHALFGWDKSGEMDMGGGAMYLTFGRGEAMYGGMYTAPPEMAGMHPFWLVYIHVQDVAKAVATARKNGATVHRERMEIPGGTIAILGDPQGAGFAVHDLQKMPVAEPVAAKVAKAGAALRKAVKKAVKVAKKAVAKVRKAPAKAKAKAKPKAKAKAKAKAKPRAKAPARRKAAARPKARPRTVRKAVRRPAKKKTRRPARAKSKR